MKIRKIQIAAFGKLTNFSLDFSDGFNVLYGVNESGKSTLMYFVRVMFYGFNNNARKTNITDNDRERFKPWHSQLYGGTISFEHNSRIYSLERNFGLTKAKDYTRLVFDATGQEVRVITPDAPGIELFGMEKTEFLNTVFVHQMSSVITEDDNIKAKLVSLAAGSQMQVSADKMKSSLQDHRKSITNDRKNSQSVIGTLQDKIHQLETDLQESYAQEKRRRALAADIEDKKNAIRELERYQSLSDKKLEAARRMREISGGKDILSLYGNAAAVDGEIARLRQPDESGRTVPTEDEIVRAGALIDEAEQAASRLAMLNLQAETIKSEMAESQSAEGFASLLESIMRQEKEWHEIGGLKTAIKEEADRLAAQFTQEDRELERLTGQVLLAQKSLDSDFESKMNEIGVARSQAIYQKSSLEQAHLAQIAENRRRLDDLAQKADEAKRHFRDSVEQLNQENGILSGLQSQLSWQQEQLGRFQQHALCPEPPTPAAGKRRLPLLAMAGAAAALAGVAGVALQQPVWPWIALLGGLTLVVVNFLFFRGNKNPVSNTSEMSGQIQSQKLQVETLQRQVDAQLSKVKNLTRDRDNYQENIKQYEAETTGPKANDSGPASDAVYAGQIAELEEIINRAAAETSELQAAHAGQKQQIAIQLEELNQKKSRHQFALPDDLKTQNSLLESRLSEWRESVRSLGADSIETLQALKENILQKQASFNTKAGNLASADRQIQLDNDLRQQILAQFTQIGNGYFQADNFNQAKALVLAARRISGQIKELSLEKKHLAERIDAASTGQSKLEIEAKIDTNSNWIAANYPDAEQLHENEEFQIKQDQALAQQEVQTASLQLGQLITELKTLEQGSQLPVEIEREISQLMENLAACQSEVRSIDLAIELITETDDEMRQTFGPIINAKAAEYLAGLTGNSCQLLRVENDFNVQVEDPVTHQFKSHDFFSGGKVDQIYLALRLAIADAVYSTDTAGNLPFSFDDILVQYDQQRGRQAVDFLIGKSEQQQRQMIFITCHDHILEYCATKNCHVNRLN